MRQAGIIRDEAKATLFADYLESQGISSRIETVPDGWALWIHDEEHVGRAVRELEEFTRHPDDERYVQGAKSARDQGRQRDRPETLLQRKTGQRNVIHMRFGRRSAGHSPVTMLLIGVSVLVALGSGIGEQMEPMLRWLTISDIHVEGEMFSYRPGLAEIREGQVWRLLTPIFIHFGVLHLLFNAANVFMLGRILELRQGTWRYVWLVLLTAVPSNLAQYAYGGPNFGGLSGVMYGLFGYLWIRGHFDPRWGMRLTPQTIVVMMGWFFLCLFGFIENVANMAHGVGLVTGMMAGYFAASISNASRA